MGSPGRVWIQLGFRVFGSLLPISASPSCPAVAAGPPLVGPWCGFDWSHRGGCRHRPSRPRSTISSHFESVGSGSGFVRRWELLPLPPSQPPSPSLLVDAPLSLGRAGFTGLGFPVVRVWGWGRTKENRESRGWGLREWPPKWAPPLSTEF